MGKLANGNIIFVFVSSSDKLLFKFKYTQVKFKKRYFKPL